MDTDNQQLQTWHQKVSGFLALFTSTGTLICCALPAAVAAVAGGTAVTSLISIFPWLVPLSANKEWFFLGAAVMLIISGILIFRPKGTVACTITGGQGCEVAGNFTRLTFWTSLIIFLIGVFFAYAIVPILRIL